VVPKASQAAAVGFLLANGFRAPSFLTSPEILNRIEPFGIVARLRTAQASLLNAVLQPSRLDRMIEQAALSPATSYTPLALLADLRVGLWSELKTPARAIDVYRRNVQRAHLATIDARLHGGAAPSDEIRALLKGELRAIDGMIAAALRAVTDVTTRRHLQDARDSIAMSLDPRAMRQRPTPGGGGGRGRGSGAGDAPLELHPGTPHDRYDEALDPFMQPSVACWHDWLIK
jgi:hypothetical protein